MTHTSEQILIAAPCERVWQTLANIGAVAQWNPTVEHAVATSTQSEGVGAGRSCDVAGMGTIQETVVEWD